MGFLDRLLGAKTTHAEKMEIGDDWFKEICDAIGRHAESKRVDYGEQQHLEVVGESFYQENLSRLAGGAPGEDAGWMSGFLAPEPFNKYDPNALAVYVILEEGEKYDALKVGYLPKEMAARTQNKVARKLAQEHKLIPLLIYIKGGTQDKPTYGVSATAKTDSINFY